MRQIRKPLAKALRKGVSLTDLADAIGEAEKAKHAAMVKASGRAAFRQNVERRERKRAANRKRKVREGIEAKARESGRKFKGTTERKYRINQWADVLMDMPDGAYVPEPGERMRRGRNRVVAHGWATVGPERQNPDGPLVNVWSGLRARTMRPVQITEEGRIVRAWLWWVYARRVMGWPFPAFGTAGDNVALWVRGEDVVRRKRIRANVFWGYESGEYGDDAWPWLAEAIRRLESGGGV